MPDVSDIEVYQKLSELWGQPVVIENVAGAAGTMAVARVAERRTQRPIRTLVSVITYVIARPP